MWETHDQVANGLTVMNKMLIESIYAAKGRELTQLHNGVARGNGLILCAQLSVSVKFRDISQHYRH